MGDIFLSLFNLYSHYVCFFIRQNHSTLSIWDRHFTYKIVQVSEYSIWINLKKLGLMKEALGKL